MTRLLFLAAILVAAALTLSAQVPAPSAGQSAGPLKPFNEWTKEDAEKLLSDSPWALTQGATGEMLDMSLNSTIGGAVGPPRSLTLRLRSAATVRLAFLRLRQLRAKYDRMSAAEQSEFNLKNQPLVVCEPCADNYIVALSPPPGKDTGVPIVFQTMSLEAAKKIVTLSNERGETRELVHFEAARSQGGEAVFFFARYNKQGEPLLTPANKKVVVTFDNEVIGTPGALSRYEFDVQKMIIAGKVVF